MDLKTYLKTSGTTQLEFARRIGVSQSTIAHWVKGRLRVPAERLIDVCRASGGRVSAHELRPDLAAAFSLAADAVPEPAPRAA